MSAGVAGGFNTHFSMPAARRQRQPLPDFRVTRIRKYRNFAARPPQLVNTPLTAHRDNG